jgi:regulator of sigma E protease
LTTLLSFLLAIAILVFVHEMGHYLAARQCGVRVLRFSIGFGKELIKTTSKKSGTEWVISAIPLGGYVRMQDESFESKPLRSRAWIVFAGPLANLIFAALAYAVLFGASREEPSPILAQPQAQSPAALAGLMAGDQIVSVNGQDIVSFTDLRWRMAQAFVGAGKNEIRLRVLRGGSPIDTVVRSTQSSDDPSAAIAAVGLAPLSTAVKVLRVQDGSVAQQAGLRAGDRIVKLAGQDVAQPDLVIKAVQASAGKPLELVVDDGSGPERVMITPTAGADGVMRIGAVVGGDVATVTVSDNLFTALTKGVTRSAEMTVLTFQALGRMIVGEISWRQISGPVTIADAAGQSAGSGIKAFIGFLALISISIAVLNLLPIPMLDGGHLLYYLWELVRGQPLSAEVQDAGRKIGLAIILMLTVLALFNDFARLAGL